MSLSGQAKVLAIVYLILTSLSVIAMVIKRTITVMSMIGTLIWLALASLIIYDTHCLTSGKCNTWSIIRTVLYGIIPVIGILALFVDLVNPKQQS